MGNTLKRGVGNVNKVGKRLPSICLHLEPVMIFAVYTGSFIITGVKIMAYCSKIKSPGEFLRLLGAYQEAVMSKHYTG